MTTDGRTPTAGRLGQANLFELSSARGRVSFSSTSIAGVPLLQYEDRRTRRAFRGKEIAFQDTVLGTLITVNLEVIPDLRTVTFTLVLPTVHVASGVMGSRLRVPGILTTTHTTIAGPPLGPERTYETLDFSGTARLVDF